VENQHRLIKGYRDLSQPEIDAMNQIKEHAAETERLSDMVRSMDADQRWASIAVTHLQQGYMALVRAIAKPESF
jgi:hypothetical protein